MISEGKPGPDRHLCANDAMAAKKTLFEREHVHRPAFAFGVTAAPAGQLSHDAFGVHSAGQHMTVITVAGNNLVTRLKGHLHADDDRLLPDVEVAESAD